MTELNDFNKKTPFFTFDGIECEAKCVSVYDGDTVNLVFNFLGEVKQHRIRLNNIDTPEIRTKNKEEKVLGVKARNFLKDKILNKIVTVKCGKHDKYGRILADIFLDGENINNLMIKEGHACEYSGGKKKKFT